MRKLYIFLVTAVIFLAGFAVFCSADENSVTVAENVKTAYGSCTDGHTYDSDYKVITVATCTAKGTKYRTCAKCRFRDIVETPRDSSNHTGLDTDEWIYFPEATCIDSGIRYHVCYDCNARVDEEVVPENENSHKGSGRYVIVTESTCSTKGVQAEICELCSGYCNQTDIAFNPQKHTVSANSATEITVIPTCAVEGQVVTYCDNCNNVAETSSVPATGNHVPDKELAVDVAPNCTYEGVCSYHCVFCDTPMYEQSLAVNPDAHEYSDFVVDAGATCVSKGEKSKYCIHCNNRIDITEIPVDADAHSFGEEWIVTKEPTCAEMGLKHKVCTLCGGNSVSVIIEKSDHTYGEEFEIIKISADETSAQVKYTCKVCAKEHIAIVPYSSGKDKSEFTPAGYYRLMTVDSSKFVMDYDKLIVSNVDESVTFKRFGENFTNFDKFMVYHADSSTFYPEDSLYTGVRLNYTAEDGKVSNYYVSVAGDVDGNGKVTPADARIALRTAASLETLTGPYFASADANGDGRISPSDARQILRVSAGLDKFSY